MRHPPLAPGWIDRPHRRIEIGDLPLESREILHDAFVTAVVHGDEARLGTAAVLALTAIGSTHHRLDFLIGRGAGAALDFDRFAVVVIDALGNGLSSSPSNSVRQAAAAFPRVSIRDMVESQRRALEALGIDRANLSRPDADGRVPSVREAMRDGENPKLRRHTSAKVDRLADQRGNAPAATQGCAASSSRSNRLGAWTR